MQISDLGKVVTGKTPSTKKTEYWNGVIPFITPGDIQKTKHITDTVRYVTEEGIKTVGNIVLPVNAICVSCIGNIGYVGKTTEKSITNQQINSIIPNKNVDDDFVYYAMKWLWPFFKSYEGQSTTVSILNKTQFSKIEIPEYTLDEQKRIATVLKTIDDKIETNEKINRNLSEQLENVFMNLFLGFSCEDELPNGWIFVKLKDIAHFSQGVQVPVEEQIDFPKEGYVRFIRIVDITQGNEKDIRYIADRQKGHVEENDIFMIRYGTPGILSWNFKGIIANNLFKITPVDNRVTYNYLYSFLKTERVLGYLSGNAVSSTMPAINFKTLNGIEVVIPDRESMEKFSNFSEVIRLKQLEIIKENRYLAHLRDELLIRLMSGNLDVSNLNI